MNSLELYLHFDGKRFEASAYDSELPSNLRGHVRPTYRIVANRKTIVGYYWNSKSVLLDGPDIGKAAIPLLRKYARAIARAKTVGAQNIYAQVVCHMKDLEMLQGYHVSRSLASALLKAGVDLDIDVSRQLR